jgi:Zn-dependent protease
MDSLLESLPQRLQMVSIQFVPFMIAVVFHEYAHGLTANRWGDKTAQEQGRLTLNPIPHIDPIGTLLFPIINMLTGIPILFGWARPVPIDPRRFKKFRPGLFCVSLAGPAMNAFLALLSAAILCSIALWVPHDFYLFEPLIKMCAVSISLNYALGLFNLIPIPPLDGSKVVESFLPFAAARKYESFAKYGMLIMFALLFTGAFSYLAAPIEFCSDWTLGLMIKLFHVPEVAL